MQCVGLGAVKLFRVLAKVVARDICGSAEFIWTHVDNRFALVRCSWGDTYVEAKLRLFRVVGSDEVYKVSLRMRRWVGGKVAQSIRNLTAYTITVKRSGDRCLAESRRTDEYNTVAKPRRADEHDTVVKSRRTGKYKTVAKPRRADEHDTVTESRAYVLSSTADEYDVVIKSRAYVLSSTLVGADPITKVVLVLPVAIPILVLKQVLARVSSI